MRKLIAFIALVACIAATTPKQPESYTLTFTPLQLRELIYVIDKSNAEHTLVTNIQQYISAQVEEQYTKAMADTVKADSTKATKAKKR